MQPKKVPSSDLVFKDETRPSEKGESRTTGHVQIAQVPERNEPDSPGEVNYSYLFSLLERLGYQGYIGCEYKPLDASKSTLAS
ncbi:hypothetical protein JZ751_019040 [Albula glossodonta]|uniref:Xylose isomerase-like TIM barrel domain-containing protein n=1 Tax=Albula glossodonta TaxID=121402 RepID=A0A8T2NMD4_9TELE|nr:hypothetical protein JZ751_019040 [Albula glossodonta]